MNTCAPRFIASSSFLLPSTDSVLWCQLKSENGREMKMPNPNSVPLIWTVDMLIVVVVDILDFDIFIFVRWRIFRCQIQIVCPGCGQLICWFLALIFLISLNIHFDIFIFVRWRCQIQIVCAGFGRGRFWYYGSTTKYLNKPVRLGWYHN